MGRYTNPVPQYYLNNGDIASAGKLYFYENGTTVKKTTYSEPLGTTGRAANTNPVTLSGEGRIPNIFGEGRYTVVFRSSDDIEQWSRDDVELSVELGQYADWSAIITYRLNDIARGSDGAYYRSLTNVNLGNDPTSSAEQWEEILFITYWNTSRTYSVDDLVVLDGILYRALAENSASTPQDNPSDWSPTTQPNFAPWNSDYTYSESQAMFYDGVYYRSITDSNKDNQPDTSAAEWEIIYILGEWNTNQTYDEDDVVVYAGLLYQSQSDSNTGNTPDISGQWSVISIAESSVRVELGGNFSAGIEVVCARQGNMVTVTAADALTTHTSSAEPTSSVGVIPAEYRPTNGASNCYIISNSGISHVLIDSSGTLVLRYLDWTGADAAKTSTVPFTISYLVSSAIT